MSTSTSALRRPLLVALLLLLVAGSATPALALPAPSKTAADQSVAAQQADLASVQSVLGNTAVQQALAAQGLSADEANSRLAQLSPQELHSLAQQVGQVQEAGMYVPTYVWVLVAVLLAALIIAVA